MILMAEQANLIKTNNKHGKAVKKKEEPTVKANYKMQWIS
jgi:hypothetical protein